MSRTYSGVTVVIPCYKQAHLVARAVDSVLQQSVSDVEVIVVDDGSPDDVVGAVSHYGNLIRYIRVVNGGLSSARNIGIASSTKEMLLFLDADDFLYPGVLASHAAAAAINSSADVYHCGWRSVDGNTGQILGEYPSLPFSADVFHTLLDSNRWPCHCMVVRKSLFDRIGCFDVSLKSLEDWDLWLRAAYHGATFQSVADAWVAYCTYPCSMSRNHIVMWAMSRCVLLQHGRSHTHCLHCPRRMHQALAHLRYIHLIAPHQHVIVHYLSHRLYLNTLYLAIDCFRLDVVAGRHVVRFLLGSVLRSIMQSLSVKYLSSRAL